MSVLSWQAGNVSGCFLAGTMIQALLQVNDPGYEPQRWQGTLLVSSMALLLYIVNVWGHDLWPQIQNVLMIVHVSAFLAVVVALWVLAPHQNAKAVFTKLSNDGGWSSQGLALMVGQVSAIYALIGEYRIPNLTSCLS